MLNQARLRPGVVSTWVTGDFEGLLHFSFRTFAVSSKSSLILQTARSVLIPCLHQDIQTSVGFSDGGGRSAQHQMLPNHNSRNTTAKLGLVRIVPEQLPEALRSAVRGCQHQGCDALGKKAAANPMLCVMQSRARNL